MFESSAIPQEIINSYLETSYHVDAKPPFTLKIGEASNELLAAHKKYITDCSAYLTAWNPLSQCSSDSENTSHQNALLQTLTRRSLNFVPGIGQHPSNSWPGESSVLVFGVTLEASKRLGARFEQNAIVWIGSDAVPQLILLR